MSKIVTAVNAMISNTDLISNVIQGDMESEVFFKYDKKHLWSIFVGDNNTYILNYYPGTQDLEALAAIPEENWSHEGIRSIQYNTKDLGTREALESFKELSSIVNSKVYGMDDILDDIIGNAKF